MSCDCASVIAAALHTFGGLSQCTYTRTYIYTFVPYIEKKRSTGCKALCNPLVVCIGSMKMGSRVKKL